MNVHSTKRGENMPRSKEAFEEMRLKSSTHIMETALKLFSERGYHATSISMIAKEAGIAAGLMYNYFSGKEDLLEKIMDENFLHIYSFVRGKFDIANGSTIEQDMSFAINDMGKLIDKTFEAINSREDSWKLLISVMFQPDVSNMARDRIEQFTNHLEHLYLSYFNSKPVKNPAKSAKVLATLMHGAFLNCAYSGDFENIRLLRETVIQKLLEEGV